MTTLYLKKVNINIFILFFLSIISIVSPIIVHSLGLKGTEFLPIFFALSLGAYILNPLYLIILSIVSPLINYFITNMPMPPTLYFLIFESIIFSFMISILKNKNIPFILAVLFAFVLGRLSSFILTFIFNVNISEWFSGVVNGYKGVIVNCIIAYGVYLIFNSNKIKE